jgi:hypothetical protein
MGHFFPNGPYSQDVNVTNVETFSDFSNSTFRCGHKRGHLHQFRCLSGTAEAIDLQYGKDLSQMRELPRTIARENGGLSLCDRNEMQLR